MGRYSFLGHQVATFSQNVASCRDYPHQSCLQIRSIHKNNDYFNKNGSTLSLNTSMHHAAQLYSGRAFSVFARKSYTQPHRLFPISEEHILTPKDGATYKLDGHTDTDSLKALYKVVIRTSRNFDSGISYSDAGVLLAIIGEHGRCCVCRISPFKVGKIDSLSLHSNQTSFGASSQPRFQRGSTDTITLSGPDLGKLEAIWVAPEAGTWRIGEVRITMFPQKAMLDGLNLVENSDFIVFLYDFQGKDILIGDGNSVPAAELEASLPCQLSYENYLLLDSTRKDYAPTKSIEEIREKGMKEYKILKFSLLSYTSMLVMFGTAISVACGFTEIAEGFFVGGLLGLFNLVFLQRAVDQLPALNSSSNSMPETSISNREELYSSSASHRDVNEEKTRDKAKVAEGNTNELKMEHFQVVNSFSGFRAPLTRFAGIMALVTIIAKLAPNTNIHSISKEVLLAGAAGFLMSKIAIVLASNKPISINMPN